MPVLVTCPLGSPAMQEKEYEPRHEKTCFCHMWTTKAFVVCSLNSCYVRNFKTLASFSSWAGWFEFNLVANPRRWAFSWRGSYGVFGVGGKINQHHSAHSMVLNSDSCDRFLCPLQTAMTDPYNPSIHLNQTVPSPKMCLQKGQVDHLNPTCPEGQIWSLQQSRKVTFQQSRQEAPK